MSPCSDDLVRDPARAGLLSREDRAALCHQPSACLALSALDMRRTTATSNTRISTPKTARSLVFSRVVAVAS